VAKNERSHNSNPPTCLRKRATLSVRASVEEHGGGSFSGTFERQMREGSENGASLINLMCSSLDPDYVKSLNLGAIWNFCEGPGLPWLGIRVWGTKSLL